MTTNCWTVLLEICLTDLFKYFFITSQQLIGQQVIYNNWNSRKHFFFFGGGKYGSRFLSLPHGSVLVMLLPRDPRRFKMTVHFSLRAATHRHTHTRLLRSGSRLVHQPVSLHPSLVLAMLCVCVRVPSGAAELLGQRQWRRWREWRRRRRAQTYDRHSFSHQNQRAFWFLRGSLKLPKPISGTCFRLFSGYFILPINGGPSKGKTELRYFTLCVCETLNGPCCCVKPPCFQFGELEESGVLLFG